MLNERILMTFLFSSEDCENADWQIRNAIKKSNVFDFIFF